MTYTEAKISTFALGVITAMTGNDNFPDSATLLADVKAAQIAYATALSAAQDGSRMQIAEKNACKATLLEALRKLCDMVNYVAAGDRVKILSSGFEPSKETATAAVLVPAKNMVVTYGENSGEMDISLEGAKNHRGFVYEYAVIDGVADASAVVNWVTKPCNTASYTFTNMPVGQKVLIRVGMSGSRKQVIYTEPVIKLVA